MLTFEIMNSHTFSHVGTPSAEEISSTKSMLNAYGGIPNQKLQGFRAPFLNYTKDTLNILSQQGFLYDSSSSAVTDDAYWPYTLDNGMANDCWTGICAAGEVKLPGLWEIPMYSVLDNASVPQLMDVYLAGSPADVKQCKLFLLFQSRFTHVYSIIIISKGVKLLSTSITTATVSHSVSTFIPVSINSKLRTKKPNVLTQFFF